MSRVSNARALGPWLVVFYDEDHKRGHFEKVVFGRRAQNATRSACPSMSSAVDRGSSTRLSLRLRGNATAVQQMEAACALAFEEANSLRASARRCLQHHDLQHCAMPFVRIDTAAELKRFGQTWPPQIDAAFARPPVCRDAPATTRRATGAKLLAIPKTGTESMEKLLNIVPHGSRCTGSKNHRPAVSCADFTRDSRTPVLSVIRAHEERLFSFFGFCVHGWRSELPSPIVLCELAVRLLEAQHEAAAATTGGEAARDAARVAAVSDAFERWLLFAFSRLNAAWVARAPVPFGVATRGYEFTSWDSHTFIVQPYTWWLRDAHGDLSARWLLRTDNLSADWERVGRCALGRPLASVRENAGKASTNGSRLASKWFSSSSSTTRRDRGPLRAAAFLTPLAKAVLSLNFRADRVLFGRYLHSGPP